MSAKKYILNHADKNQAIIVNEAHHVPQHRIFVKSLLGDLYKKGYRYLCLEAIGYDIVHQMYIQQLTPSVMFGYGFYTRESCFAELMREAARTGYMIYGYEPTERTSTPAERDSLQARNISYIWGNDPKAKVLVLAGYGHVDQSWTHSMSSVLKRDYGIKTLTVNQTNLYEHPTPYYESPLYTSFTEHFDFNKPSVLIDSKGEIDNRVYKIADVMVYSPRVKYINGRPDWLLEEGARHVVPVRASKKTTVIKAYYAYEQVKRDQPSDLYVPIDQVVTKNNSGSYDLMLPKGLFLIQYLDSKNNVVWAYYKSVK